MKEKDLVEFLHSSDFTKNDIFKIRQKYANPDWKPGDRSIRRLYKSWTVELINAMYRAKVCPKQDFDKVVEFAYVVVDAEKYKLDILKAKEALRIDALYMQYVESQE